MKITTQIPVRALALSLFTPRLLSYIAQIAICPEHVILGLGRVTPRITCDYVWLSSSEVPACNLERWMTNFNGRSFFFVVFSLFFVARANQKIRLLSLGRESKLSSRAKKRYQQSRDLSSRAHH
jgi:hypothetical protein